ncbi:MAG TPA: MFS transporter [Caulobacteraceae bacterium]
MAHATATKSGVSAVGETPRLPVSHVAAVVIGNALQFYDFLTYAFFAAQIGRTFFPSHDASTSLLASLATFGAGFVTRPIGAVVIGTMGDRVGRKPAMILSFALMGFAIVGLALTPSYAAIGIAAPIAAIAFRLLQGFALGGEVGPSTAYLIEAAPPARRGFFVSLQYATQDAAVLAAGLIGLALANIFDARGLDQWGWRIAFMVGAAIVPFGLMMRGRLNETLHEGAVVEADLGPSGLRPYARVAALALAMLGAGTIATYVMSYMTTYASATLHMAANLAFGATVTVGLCGVLFDPLGGWLSDRFGRKRVMIAPWAILLAAVFPCFWVITHFRTGVALFGATAVLTIPGAIASASVLVTITESLPRRVRSGALATLYALAISTFGGTTQFAITWLIRATGDPLAPAWYMAGAVAVGLVAMMLMRETAPGRSGPKGAALLPAIA